MAKLADMGSVLGMAGMWIVMRSRGERMHVDSHEKQRGSRLERRWEAEAGTKVGGRGWGPLNNAGEIRMPAAA